MIPQETPSPQSSKDRLRLWLKLLKTSNTIEGEIRRRMRDTFGSTLPRFDVMAALYRFPEGLKMSDLSGLLRVSNANVTGIVDRLTEDGYVLRVTQPGDRRAQIARLTPAGSKAFGELAAAHEGWVNDLFAGVDGKDMADLSAMLSDILTHLEDEAPDDL